MAQYETDPTAEGKRLIERWQNAQTARDRVKSQLTSAECEVANAKNALGKWMVPEDAKTGEKFCIWYGDNLIEVENLGNFDYSVRIRTRGRRGL